MTFSTKDKQFIYKKLQELVKIDFKETRQIKNLVKEVKTYSQIQQQNSSVELITEAIKIDRQAILLKELIDFYKIIRDRELERIRNRSFLKANKYQSISLFFIRILEGLGEYAAKASDRYADLLQDNDMTLSLIASEAFSKMGSLAKDSLPIIYEVMSKKGVYQFPYRLGQTIVNISQDYPEVINETIEKLDSSSEKLLQGIAYTISLLGYQAKSAKDKLVNIANTYSENTRSLAIMALGYLGETDEIVANLLIDATQDSEWYIRGNAIRSLGKLKIKPEISIPLIVRALHDEEGDDWTVQESAIEALRDFGTIAKNSLGALVELKEENSIEIGEGDFSLNKLIDDAIAAISVEN
ncbi:MAG: HEAT repeat domain-containing protein [Hydrococcus sp. Prado102]|jgi:HEAT repeat protein|nr:HEAT repeat domain-containing protein [Hydrococcus sp. Prado102]